jgi:putative ABC transport system permease protein
MTPRRNALAPGCWLLLQDLRYAIRTLLRAPGFAIAAILTLALGIGANTAIFSVVDAVLLRPLPYPSPNRLVMIWDQLTKLGVERLGLSADIYRQYAAQNVFEQAASFRTFDRTFTTPENVERLSSIMAEPALFELLGPKPEIGRVFTPEDGEAVAVISHSLSLRFAGKKIQVDDRSYTVIGVLPPQFRFGNGATPIEIWTPIWHSNMGGLSMLARLKPGASLPAAQSAIDASVKHLNETVHPHWGPNGEDPGFRASVIPLRDELFGSLRFTTLILLCSVAAVLLIACANVANLLLVRAVAREKETAIRRALGATEGRLIQQWLTEAALLALIGGALGSIAAVWGVCALIALSPSALPALTIDTRALLFTLAISILSCLFFGLAPGAWRATPRTSRHRRRAASLLVTAEVALAVMLLIGAGLLLKSYARLRHVDPGFHPEHVLTMRIQYPPTRPMMKTRLASFFTELCDRIAAMPGVASAGAVSRLPVEGGVNGRGGNPFSIEGQRWYPDGPVPQIAHTQIVDPEYFHAMQIPLLQGRYFSPRDTSASPAVTVVNETLARGFFPKGAIGHQILLGAPQPNSTWLTIVGVVGDVKTAALSHETMPQFYTPVAQDPSTAMSLVVRTALDPATIARSVAQVVRTIDPSLPVYDVVTMEDRIARSIGQPRFETTLLAFFAAAALFLAAIGIFGVVAHSTAQRTHEIGIRMALGADRASVIQTVMLDGLRPAIVGVASGLTGAFFLTRLIKSELFQVADKDPQSFLLAAIVLTLVATAACLIPASRASKVDPVIALREQN